MCVCVCEGGSNSLEITRKGGGTKDPSLAKRGISIYSLSFSLSFVAMRYGTCYFSSCFVSRKTCYFAPSNGGGGSLRGQQTTDLTY